MLRRVENWVVPRLFQVEIVKVGQIFLEMYRTVGIDHTRKLEINAVHIDEFHQALCLGELRDISIIIGHVVDEEPVFDLTRIDQECFKHLQGLHDHLVQII